MPPRLALKVDVDTDRGFLEGVPALGDIFSARGIRASFFVALGPDHSGRTVWRVFRHRGFLDKMRRTRAPAVYGLKTLLYGMLLPGPLIGAAAPRLLPALAEAGHEVGLHGYDHVLWHDRLAKMTLDEVAREVTQAQELYVRSLGGPARSFAAPGWQCGAASKELLAARGFLYASDTRGYVPYWPRFGSRTVKLLEIPTTLPTLDELLGFEGCGLRDYSRLILSRLKDGQPQVLTLHAELEGGPYRQEFTWFLDRCLERGVDFFRLQDWAGELLSHSDGIAMAPVQVGRLPGRAGTVARQGPLDVGL